jgi:hypothetical protein
MFGVASRVQYVVKKVPKGIMGSITQVSFATKFNEND